LDLRTAAKRYEEMRRFWAKEIALKLAQGFYRTQVHILRELEARGCPRRTEDVFAALPSSYGSQHSRATSGHALLRRLRQTALVTRAKRQGTYWYALSELGALVLLYLPKTNMDEDDKSAPKNQHGDEEKMPPKTNMDEDESVERKRRGRSRKRLVAALDV
jgi:hypothetical protein